MHSQSMLHKIDQILGLRTAAEASSSTAKSPVVGHPDGKTLVTPEKSASPIVPPPTPESGNVPPDSSSSSSSSSSSFQPLSRSPAQKNLLGSSMRPPNPVNTGSSSLPSLGNYIPTTVSVVGGRDGWGPSLPKGERSNYASGTSGGWGCRICGCPHEFDASGEKICWCDSCQKSGCGPVVYITNSNLLPLNRKQQLPQQQESNSPAAGSSDHKEQESNAAPPADAGMTTTPPVDQRSPLERQRQQVLTKRASEILNAGDAPNKFDLLHIKSYSELLLAVRLIFAHCMQSLPKNSNHCALYADYLVHLKGLTTSDSNGQGQVKITQDNQLLTDVLNMCQLEAERTRTADSYHKNVLSADPDAASEVKRRGLVNMQLLGTLYCRKRVKTYLIDKVIKELIYFPEEGTEHEAYKLLCACALLQTIGHSLLKISLEIPIDAYMKRLKELQDKPLVQDDPELADGRRRVQEDLYPIPFLYRESVRTAIGEILLQHHTHSWKAPADSQDEVTSEQSQEDEEPVASTSSQLANTSKLTDNNPASADNNPKHIDNNPKPTDNNPTPSNNDPIPRDDNLKLNPTSTDNESDNSKSGDSLKLVDSDSTPSNNDPISRESDDRLNRVENNPKFVGNNCEPPATSGIGSGDDLASQIYANDILAVEVRELKEKLEKMKQGMSEYGVLCREYAGERDDLRDRLRETVKREQKLKKLQKQELDGVSFREKKLKEELEEACAREKRRSREVDECKDKLKQAGDRHMRREMEHHEQVTKLREVERKGIMDGIRLRGQNDILKKEMQKLVANDKGPAAHRLECAICMAAERAVVLQPCKHFVTCKECTNDLVSTGGARCPICREKIRKTLDVHFA
jgi:hypothetical protein